MDSPIGSVPLTAPVRPAPLPPAHRERSKERRLHTPPDWMLSALFACVSFADCAYRFCASSRTAFRIGSLGNTSFVDPRHCPTDDSLKIDEEEPALRSRHIPIRV